MPNKYNDSESNTEKTNGLVIGGVVALLAAIGAAALYFSSQPTPAPTTIINTPPNPAAPTAPAPEKQTTIIDRTVEKAVPGATKVIEVPKPFAVPQAPSTTDKSVTPKDSPDSSKEPSPAASKSPDPVSKP